MVSKNTLVGQLRIVDTVITKNSGHSRFLGGPKTEEHSVYGRPHARTSGKRYPHSSIRQQRRAALQHLKLASRREYGA